MSHGGFMLIASLLVRDEEKIVAANIEHHLAQGVDAFIVTDHLSEDNTPDIVRSYPEVLHYTRITDEGYHQWEWVTRMAHIASDMGADWIVHLDADEFWYGFDVLSEVPENISVVYSGSSCNPFESNGKSCRDFLPLYEYKNDVLFDSSRYEYFKYSDYKVCKGVKIVHRSSATCVVSQGNHNIDKIVGNRGYTDMIHIDHYPVRCYEHFHRKVRNGGEAYAKATDLDPTLGFHWRNWYKELLNARLIDEYAKVSVNRDKIDELLNKGEIFHRSQENWRGNSSWLPLF